MSGRKGFTLIELLVVIAIIALLLSVLLPSLRKAKELASGIVCLNNQKQFALAWTMYASANNDKVVGGECKYDTTNDVPPWAMPPLHNDGGHENGNPNVTLEQRINGLREGALFDYLDNPKNYHCPGDNRVKRGTSNGAGPRYQLYRSYSMPYGVASNTTKNTKQWFFRPVTKADQIRTPGEKYVFVEEAYDGRVYNYNDECWNFIPYLSNGDYAYHMWDSLASFHVKSCTFGFADGHARKHKWRDKKTIDFFVDRERTAGNNTWTDPGNVDLEWLSDHYPFISAQ